MRITNTFYYSGFFLIAAGLIGLALLCSQGCRDNSNKQGASSAKKESLFGKPALVRPKAIRPKSTLPPPSKEVVVKLIEPGEEPLKKMRYAFRAGKRDTVQVTMSEKISVTKDGKKRPTRVSPPVSFELTASVASAPKQGPTKLKLVFGRSSISDASANAPRSLVADLLSSLEGVAGIQTVTDKGSVESTDVQLTGGANPAVSKFWRGTQRLAQNLIRFPEEPVGVGARWEATRDIELATSTHQTTKYKLVALDRRGGTVEAEINQVGRPALVPEMSNKVIETYLDAFKAIGKARLEFKFESGICLGEIETTADATYTAESNIEDNTTEYHTVQTVEIKRATSAKKAKK